MKNRKGFTLMEMVVVIAIVVFLAAVTMSSISQYTKRARDLSANINAHDAAIASEEAIIENYLMTTRPTEGNPTTNNSQQAVVPSTEPTTEASTEASTTKKNDPLPPPEDPTTASTQAQTEAPQDPVTPPAGNGNVTTTNTGYSQVKSLTAPEGMKVSEVNYNSWGGDFKLKIDKDLQQYKYLTVTVKIDGNGKFSQVNGADIKSVSADKKTISLTFVNNSNLPYYADPHFSSNGNVQVYFNFDNNQGGNMNITVTGSN